MVKQNIIDEKTINNLNYELLKKQFPNAIGIDEDGRYIIDPQKLQMSLDPSKADIKENGYGLNWVGKKEAYYKAFSKNYKVLKPLNDDNSKNWDTTENILIKGDNLDALKILRHNYFESIKMIYIDPPYNTKNDGFVYNDNFTSNTEETLEELGYDKEYIDYIENIQGAKTHSGWLSFIYPRLLLARDLLKDDGVIFISIDDNEVAQLRLLCDEVFGEDNFVNQLIWKKKAGGGSDAKYFADDHEYILVYAKNENMINRFFMKMNEKQKREYKYKDENYKTLGLYKRKNLYQSGIDDNRPNLRYEIIAPDNTKILPPTIWRWSKETLEQEMAKNKVDIIKNSKGEWQVFTKNYMFEDDSSERLIKPRTILTDFGLTRDGNNDIKLLFKKQYFSYPKPKTLIKHLLSIISSKNDIILDFFAGSGTTAHAVMELNAQDNGDRKFIAVQWAEKTPEKSEAKKAGYETIFDITQERIKRAGDKIIKDDITKQDLDIGFRTFEIVEDVKQHIYQKSLEDMKQEDMLYFMEQKGIETSEDILYNLLVADGLPLSTKIQTLIIDKLYIASNVAFILGDVGIDELITELKPQKELEYVTVYSPNISDDKFTLECESALSSIGIKSNKLRFRG